MFYKVHPTSRIPLIFLIIFSGKRKYLLRKILTKFSIHQHIFSISVDI